MIMQNNDSEPCECWKTCPEFKQVDRSLKASEAKYRALFENLQDTFYQADLHGRLTLISPSVTRLLGYSVQEALSLNLNDLYACQTERNRLWDSLHEYGTLEGDEAQFRCKDGSVVWGSLNAQYYYDDNGRVQGVEGMVRDISKQKQTEQRLLEANRELQATLHHLKQTQTELIHVEKMAALGRLTAMVAHEINSPLAAIRSSTRNITFALTETLRRLPALFQQLSAEELAAFLALVQRGLDNTRSTTSKEERHLRRTLQRELEAQAIQDADEIADTLVDMGIHHDIRAFLPLLQGNAQKEGLETAHHLLVQWTNSRNVELAVDRASRIITALKNYAWHEESGHKIHADITEGIDCVLTIFDQELRQQIAVHRRYDAVPAILCYPGELNQVWTNVIQHLIQAIDGIGTLDIAVTLDASQGETHPHVMVRMAGSRADEIGMSPAQKAEALFAVAQNDEQRCAGWHVCQKILAQHGGKIDVENQDGCKIFRVWLPIMPNSQHEEGEAAQNQDFLPPSTRAERTAYRNRSPFAMSLLNQIA